LPDGAWLGRHPYIRPLARTRDEHDRFVLVVLSQERTRYFISRIGRIDEVLQVKGSRLPMELTDQVPRDRADGVATDAEKLETHALGHIAELALAELEARTLLFSTTTPKLRHAVVEALSKEAQRNIGADFTVEPHGPPSAVAAAAEPAERAVEEREEVATLRRMIDAGPAGAGWGLRPVLDALLPGRVLTLAVDEAFVHPGSRCCNCRALWDRVPEVCPACGSAGIEPVGDVVELAIERTLERKGTFDLVCSAPARRIMAGRAPIAALYRW
jgi:hypothetical protein